jgi:hypothetical protein
MFIKIDRVTMKHDTPTLNWLNEVFAALGNEAKSCLVCMEFQNTPQRLLCNHWKIVSVIQKHPRRRICDGSHASHEFGKTLSNRGDSAIVGATESKRHYSLMRRIGNTLHRQLFGNPRVRQHGFSDARWTTENNVRRVMYF